MAVGRRDGHLAHAPEPVANAPWGPALADIFDALIERVRFAADSPLEEAVSSEPVSEWGSSAAGNYGTIPRRLWMITEAEKGYFGLEYA